MAIQGRPIFALSESIEYGKRVAHALDRELGPLEELEFEDGEHKILPRADVESRDIYLIQSLYPESRAVVDRKICRLLFLAATLKDMGASKVTAVAPYLAFSRQDRRAGPSDALTNRYLAELMETSGIECLMTIDVHDLPAFENAYRCRTVHLEADEIFAGHLERLAKTADIVVVSPDLGGVRRAKSFAKLLGRRAEREIRWALVDKTRLQRGVTAHGVIGDIRGKVAVLYDDMITTGGTVFHAARACMGAGAQYVIAVATHGIFCDGASQNLALPELKRLIVSDTVERNGLAPELRRDKLTVLSSVPIVAAAIQRLEAGQNGSRDEREVGKRAKAG